MGTYDLKRIVESISNLKSENFYNAICLSLSEVLGASHVFLAQVDESTMHASTIALAAYDEIVDNISYDIRCTPCNDVRCGGISSYSSGVQALFPDDRLLVDMGIEAYVGVPLQSLSGKTDTILVALFQHEIGDALQVESFFSLFTGLIQREIDKDRFIAKLDFANQLIEQSHEAIFICNKNVEITYVNTAFTKMTGYTLDEVLGQNPKILSSNQHDQHFYRAMWHQIDKKGKWSGEITNKTKQGTLYTQFLSITQMQTNGEICYVAFILDITEKKEAEQKIYFHANHDQLTGLTNRFYFKERISELVSSLSYQDEESTNLAVIYFDVDKFQDINTVYGLSFGDKVLCQLAERLESSFKECAFSRIDGDSFAVLQTYQQVSELELVCKQVSALLVEPFLIGGISQQVSVTLGASTYQQAKSISSQDKVEKIARRLVRQAELATLNAKQVGAPFLHFCKEMDDKVKKHNLLVEQLTQAVKNDELEVHFQPIIDVQSNTVAKFESLVRWCNQGQWVSPAVFIPLAEESRVIIELGELVLRKTCQQIKYLEAQGYNQFVFNVNRSLFEFTEFNPHRNAWLEIITEQNVNPSQISFELTESVLAPENTNHLEVLTQLKSAGCLISLDDFGTGYSSLSYLRRFPVDVLKLDKSFIDEIHTNSGDEALVKSIIQMSQVLGIKVVAEGVELQQQLAVLKEAGCDFIQGYYFSKPLPGDEIQAFLTQLTREH
ncbi:GGDEF domain-containing phosphodiesterase [Pseudoalteromonas sp. L1]|uniref:putative bifunctional diguanylate cyclase/phosphodiesterase n=1 Tax=Pseudoalteromonas sp. L1 TaxID=195716 RepID=UPI001F429B9F|nr:EAL domain-containing protein [Pseudoalteromonas sp. L1]